MPPNFISIIIKKGMGIHENPFNLKSREKIAPPLYYSAALQ